MKLSSWLSHVLGCLALLQSDVVAHPYHTSHRLDHKLGVMALVLPVNFTSQSHPAFLYLDLNAVLGNEGMPFEGRFYGSRNLCVTAMMVRLQHTNEFWNGFTVGVQGTAAEVFPGTSVPEPGSLALLGLSLLGLAATRKLKQR